MVFLWMAAVAILCLLTLKYQYGIYVLAFLVPLAADHVGFVLKGDWRVEVADFLPSFSVLAICIFIGLMLATACGYHTEKEKHPITSILALVTCWSATTLLWPYDFGHNLFQFGLMGLNFILYYLVVHSIQKVSAYNRLMWCWIAAGVLIAFLTFVNALLQGRHVFGLEILNGLNFRMEWLALPVRAESLANVNETALILNLTTCVTIGMLLSAPNRTQAKVLFSMAAFMILGNLLTMSRGGLLALLAMLYFIIITLRKFNSKLILHMVSLHVLIALLFMAQIGITLLTSPDTSTTNKPIRATTTGQTSFLTGRMNMLWKPGVKRLLDQGPIKGLGIGAMKSYRNAPHGHSIYFSTLIDLGLVGLMLAALVPIILCRNFSAMRPFQESYLQRMYLSLFGGLVAIAVHGLVDFEYNTPELWFFLGLVVLTYHLAKKELASA